MPKPPVAVRRLADLDAIVCADLFDLCADQPDASVDMILCDLPYGTTACSWDTVIPFEPMWKAFKRIIKPRGAIVLTASQPFTSKLVCSNLEMFRYEWVWDKKYTANPFIAKTQPLRVAEEVLIFSFGGENYFAQFGVRPQLWRRHNPSFKSKNGEIFGGNQREFPNSSTRDWTYPTNILDYPHENPYIRETLHPTQKPVALFEYLIRTYTQPGELVFDPCVGSGTTAIAARKVGRHFICGDSSQEYVKIANERLQNTDPYQDRRVGPSLVQHSLFAAVAV